MGLLPFGGIKVDFLTFLIKAILLFFSGIALFMIADKEKIAGAFFFAFGIILIILSMASLGGAIGSFILLLGGIFQNV